MATLFSVSLDAFESQKLGIIAFQHVQVNKNNYISAERILFCFKSKTVFVSNFQIYQ